MKHQKIQSGDWVRKINHTTFCKVNHEPGKKEEDNDNEKPILLVEKIKNICGSLFKINDAYSVHVENLVVLTEEEAIEYNKRWEECIISPTTEPFEIGSCIREDTGEPKIKLPKLHTLKRKLFENRMLSPASNFEGYRCHFCGFYHIGKKKIETA